MDCGYWGRKSKMDDLGKGTPFSGITRAAQGVQTEELENATWKLNPERLRKIEKNLPMIRIRLELVPPMGIGRVIDRPRGLQRRRIKGPIYRSPTCSRARPFDKVYPTAVNQSSLDGKWLVRPARSIRGGRWLIIHRDQSSR